MQKDSSARQKTPEDAALRRKRQQAIIYRRRRLRLVLGVIGVSLFIVITVLVAIAVSRNNARVSTEELLAGGARSPTAPIAATSEERPAFARFGDRNLLLPVAAGDATIIAYQPVSDARAMALTPIGEQVNANGFVRFFRGLFSGEPDVRYYQLPGGDGEPTTSVLVGAPPDSAVTSPVSGVVVGVTPYKLFGKYDDYQVDIRPEEKGGVTVTLLFIDAPAVSIGERVDAGKTLLGVVRACPAEVGEVLAAYTHDTGSHVHIQVFEEPIR